MFDSITQRRIVFSCISILGILIAATNTASAQTCSQDCLRVYSIALSDLGTYINGTAKLWDETGSAGGTKSAVVHGVWTRPDGSTFDQYDVIGTRLRAEFRLNTAGVPGKYTLTVADATKTGYTFDPDNSNILSASIGDDISANQAPTAVANADVTSGSLPLTVNFTSVGSEDTDGTVNSYAWDFGDGSPPLDEVDPTHTYLNVGNYTATLTVTDNEGATDSNSISIVVIDDIAGCTFNCMAVDRISMGYKANKGKVKGKVYIVDENNSAAEGATVHAFWTQPDGMRVDQSRVVKSNSRANFGLAADAAGSYTLTVVEVTKTGHVFDPDSSNVLEGAITISP